MSWCFLFMQHISWQHLSISAKAQLLLIIIVIPKLFFCKFFDPKFFWTNKSLLPSFFLIKSFFTSIFLGHIFVPKTFWTQNFFDAKFVGLKFVLDPNTFTAQNDNLFCLSTWQYNSWENKTRERFYFTSFFISSNYL